MKILKSIILLTGITFSSLSIGSFQGEMDSTDRYNTVRSGLTVFIDAGTGCHYLSNGGGEIIPRMKYNSKQPQMVHHVCTGHEGEEALRKVNRIKARELSE